MCAFAWPHFQSLLKRIFLSLLSSSQGFFLMSKSFMLHTNPNSFTPIISHYCTFMVRSTLTFPELARTILLWIIFISPYTISHNSLIQIPSLITPSSKSVPFRSFNYCIFSLYVPHWCTEIHSYQLLTLGSPSMPSLWVFWYICSNTSWDITLNCLEHIHMEFSMP